MKKLLLLFLLFGFIVYGQEKAPDQLTYDEYLGIVKKYNPLVKIANLEISKSQANLMKARGSFDPKIDIDFSKKEYAGTEYYSIFSSGFKIPTWYGIEIKAGFDDNQGVYLDPQNKTPNQGLTSLGISVPIGQSLLINERMADLSKAKIQLQLSLAERKLQAIAVLYDASIAYFNWKKSYEEVVMYEKYSSNAEKRLKGIQSLIKQGDKPAIDSVEAGIISKTRQLNLEDSKLKLNKSRLELSNYLWLENNIPLELTDDIIPEEKLELTIQETLKTNDFTQTALDTVNHPKINALQNKLELLNVDKKLKANKLLPKINVGYSYLSEPNNFSNYKLDDYKFGLDFSYPLFLRKERGDLKIAKFKIQEYEFALDVEKLELNNKIEAQKNEIESLIKQQKIIYSLVNDNMTMLKAEERLFSIGESSLFLINTRENNLVSAQLAEINLENRFYVSNSMLFKIMANPD